MKNSILFLFILFLFFEVNAKPFQNSYISFTIPDRWNCDIDQTEWVCRSEDGKEAKESIIILTAKEAGPADTFPLYESHLISPIPLKRANGQISFSKAFKKPEYVQINGHKWLDGFHLESEMPNYFTRYLITIKENIGVLVTFSAHKDDYVKYSADFSKTIQSLRVKVDKGFVVNPSDGYRPTGGSIFRPEQAILPSEPFMTAPQKAKKDKSLYIALAIVMASMGI